VPRTRNHRSLRDHARRRRFDLLIDWGWFYFITADVPALDFFFKLFGAGFSILIFSYLTSSFTLANKSMLM
jgi:membrane protein insertase Oxa1/YidC/SpoIIIJ